jgi:hypothetical protein
VPRRSLAAGLLALLVTLTGLAPGIAPQVAASSCSGWTSETTPPPSIHVFRHATGAVDTVNFKVYAKNVLSREWIGSWTTASLRSGALAVKNYAWYQVLHWRGGVNGGGLCFDVRDDTQDQVYDPSKPTWSTAASAVDDTWATLVTKNGHIFATYYNAGAVNEPCGSNANGWKAYQWGTQACGLDGLSVTQIILTYYYPDVTVANPPPGGSPPPSPSPTPAPSATPAPSSAATPGPTASASASATPNATPTPRPTPLPTPKPTAAPLPTPPPDQQPGGGQATVATASAPPPPPPAHPAPVVAKPSAKSEAHPRPTIDWTRLRLSAPASGPLEWPWLTSLDVGAADRAALAARGAATFDDTEVDSASSIDPRLATFRAMVGPASDRLFNALLAMAGDDAIAALLRW